MRPRSPWRLLARLICQLITPVPVNTDVIDGYIDSQAAREGRTIQTRDDVPVLLDRGYVLNRHQIERLTTRDYEHPSRHPLRLVHALHLHVRAHLPRRRHHDRDAHPPRTGSRARTAARPDDAGTEPDAAAVKRACPQCGRIQPCDAHPRRVGRYGTRNPDRDLVAHNRWARRLKRQHPYCQRCGSTDKLDAHHGSHGGVVLCNACHVVEDPHARLR